MVVFSFVTFLKFQALIAKLNEGTGVNANNGIISGVLVTVGDLARVVGVSLNLFVYELHILLVALFVYKFYTSMIGQK